MRWRPWIWVMLAVLVLGVCFWWLGDKSSARRHPTPQTMGISNSATGTVATPKTLLSQSTNTLNTNQNPRLAYRLRNTSRTVGQLARQDKALLLENALIDTETGNPLAIPEHLRAKGDPGSYIVQAKAAIDDKFRGLLKDAGAAVVAYIPNNAYLVRVSAEGAERMRGLPETQVVLAYEPYFKIKSSLLGMAVNGQRLPENTRLNVLLFSDARDSTIGALQGIGAEILDETSSPFGPVVHVQASGNSLAAMAGLPGVQEIEQAHSRVLANDLSRETIGVAVDSQAPDNYLNLTGTNIVVNVNDSGVDSNHPDLSGRVFVPTNDTVSGFDTDGHGTHVAGIIASSGGQSLTVTNAEGSIMPPVAGQFRGMAPGAQILSMTLDLSFGSLGTDRFLQETAAKTNAIISNNSWHFFADSGYGLGAASYDAAVRDALPEVTGSQPLLYVFSVGNGVGMNVWDDGVNDDGQGGAADNIASPATAKNVITVGAIEQLRNLSNNVTICRVVGGQQNCVTNQQWMPVTDAGD